MKKACLSFLARPARLSRSILIVAAVGLASAAWGAATVAEHGATALTPHPAASANTYLSVLGPAPLRIYSPLLPARVALLPPLAMFDPPPLPVPTSADSTTNQLVQLGPPAPPPPLAPGTYGPPPPEASTSLVLDPTLGGSPPDSIITPQMLVQFFKPAGSNSLGGVWSVPAFVPPNPPATRPSTATYRSP